MSADRAAKPPCARCGRAIGTGWAHWPEGYLCMTCRTHALETYGPCAQPVPMARPQRAQGGFAARSVLIPRVAGVHVSAAARSG